MDIDKIIRNKLQESNDLHRQERQTAKPFVWSAVQNQIGRKRSLRWYHLAAAVVILMISFSFVFYTIQNGHNKEMELLSSKIDQLLEDYASQVELLNYKESQVESLGNELRNFELLLTNLQQQKPLSQKETIVYRTDTVYVRQVEYINTAPDPIESKVISHSTMQAQPEQVEIIMVNEKGRDDAIFSSYSYQGNSRSTEKIKVKFGPFTARKN